MAKRTAGRGWPELLHAAVRIAVTGAGGQLGRDLVSVIEGTPHDPVAWTGEALDVTNLSAVRALVGDAAPDIMIHAAAYTDVDRAEEEPDVALAVNGYGTGNVATVCAERRIPMVYVSTDYVFDGSAERPYRPEDGPRPLNAYGASKAEGERRVRESGTDYLIARTSWLYGVHGSNFVKAVLRSARERGHVQAVDDQIGSPTWTRTLAHALLELATAGARGILHVADRTPQRDGPPGGISWYQFAVGIFAESGLEIPVEPVSTEAIPRAARRPRYSALDVSRTEARLGRRLPWWRDSLRGMLEELGRGADDLSSVSTLNGV